VIAGELLDGAAPQDGSAQTLSQKVRQMQWESARKLASKASQRPILFLIFPIISLTLEDIFSFAIINPGKTIIEKKNASIMP